MIALRVEHIPKEIEKFTGNKNIITNIHSIQVYGSIMCGLLCFGQIDFILKGKSLLDYTLFFLLMNMKRIIKKDA